MDGFVATPALRPSGEAKLGNGNRPPGARVAGNGSVPKPTLGVIGFEVYYGGKGRYLYQPIMKCACTTIKTLLLELEGLPVDSNVWRRHQKQYNFFPGTAHLSYKKQRDIFAGRTKTFKFVFVRNPYTRLASAYRDKLEFEPRGVWGDQIRRSAEAHGVPLSLEISFAEFVDIVSRQSIKEMDFHWRPQFHQGRFDTINYDFVGRMERMPADLVSILERIGAPESMVARATERHNESGAGVELWETVPSATRQRFLDAFAIDFDTLGYSRDLADCENLARSILR